MSYIIDIWDLKYDPEEQMEQALQRQKNKPKGYYTGLRKDEDLTSLDC